MFNAVILVDTWKHVSPAQDFFSLLELQLLLHLTLVLLLFNMPAKCGYIGRDLQLFHLCLNLPFCHLFFKLVKDDLCFFFIGEATDRHCGDMVANYLQVAKYSVAIHRVILQDFSAITCSSWAINSGVISQCSV